MHNLRDAKALKLKHMIGNYEVVVEAHHILQEPTKFFGYTNVSLEVAVRYAESWLEYKWMKVKTITIKEVTE